MLVESTLLSSVAGLLGLILAYWTAPLLLALSIPPCGRVRARGAGCGFDLARGAFGAVLITILLCVMAGEALRRGTPLTARPKQAEVS